MQNTGQLDVIAGEAIPGPTFPVVIADSMKNYIEMNGLPYNTWVGQSPLFASDSGS